jgi:phage gp46-like protein
MTDVSTIWSPAAARADWAILAPDLARDTDLETAVVISLFTDRRADADDVIPDGSDDRRGWWGDAFADRPIGSKLWLLERAKKTEQTRLRAQDYVDEALAWLVEEGVAASVVSDAQWQAGRAPQGFLGIVVQIARPDGRIVDFNYAWAWAGVS